MEMSPDARAGRPPGSLAAAVLIVLPFVLMPAGCAGVHGVQRFGFIAGVTSAETAACREMSSKLGEDLQASLAAANIRNASVYLGHVDKDRYYLFGYYEYTGKDHEADIARLSRAGG
ncbi:MAG: hypothetical protein ABH877_05665, partial [bacterium]